MFITGQFSFSEYGMRLLIGSIIVMALHGAACGANFDSRLPKMSELQELVEHVRELPPYRSDVTVLLEFELENVPENELRRSVENIFRKIDEEQGVITDSSARRAEIQKEEERLLEEQKLPRRMKQRLRREGNRYRVDSVRTRSEREPIDESTPWQTSFVFLSEGPGSPQDTLRRDWEQQIVSIFGVRHGNVRPFRDAWAAGTVGAAAAYMLRAAMGMRISGENGGGEPDDEQLLKLANGSHHELKITVTEHPGELRQFVLQSTRSGGGSVVFRTPPGQIEPVSLVEAKDGLGNLIYRLNLHEVDAQGQALRWTEQIQNPTGKGIRKYNYTLFERSLNEPLPPETFSLERPDGWTLIDYRPDVPIAFGPEGKPISLANPATDPTVPTVSEASRSRFRTWLFIANAIAIVTIAYALFIMRRRRRESKQRD